MQYLSKEIEAIAKRKKKATNSLVKKDFSCGIFQDYRMEQSSRIENNQQ